MTILRRAIAASAILLLAASAGGAGPGSPAGAAAAAGCDAPTARAALPPPAFAGCVQQLVARSRQSPERLSAAALDALVGEVLMRSIDASAPAHVEAIETLLGELERRHETSPLQRAALVWVLQLNGRYDEARQRQGTTRTIYTSAFPTRVPSTSPRHAGELQTWVWNAKADTLSERFVDLSQGPRVIVMSAPNCHFCAQAVADIDADAGLRKAFAAHAIWVDRPFSGLDQDAMLAWTAAHPDAPITVLLDPAGWPRPGSRGTPDFLFLRDGKVVRELVGWPPGHEDDARQAFRAIGVDASP